MSSGIFLQYFSASQNSSDLVLDWSLAIFTPKKSLPDLPAKIILNLPISSSSSSALEVLGWKSLKIRRHFHRCCFVFKALNGLIDFSFNNPLSSKIHGYNTRNSFLRRLPKLRTCWGQNISGYLFNKEWNNLPNDIKSADKYNVFKNRFLRIIN